MAAHKDRACAAKANSASVLGAREVQNVAEHPQEGRIRRHVHRGRNVVDIQFDRHRFTSSPVRGRGTVTNKGWDCEFIKLTYLNSTDLPSVNIGDSGFRQGLKPALILRRLRQSGLKP